MTTVMCIQFQNTLKMSLIEHVLWKESPILKKYKEATLTIVMLFPNQRHPEKVLLIWHKKWKTSKER
ncbi:uncharacterized protein LOC111110426 isoform X2 [Crassostrea virginica]